MVEAPAGGPEQGQVEIALAVPVRGASVLVARRAPGLHLAGYWEFPGGKVEAGEDPAAAARRELAEETGLDAVELAPLSIFVHDYPDRSIRFHVFLAREPRGEVRLESGSEWGWKTLAELERLELPPANLQLLGALRRHLRGGA